MFVYMSQFSIFCMLINPCHMSENFPNITGITESKCFDYLNNRHKNIKFTIELENQGKLSFLDVFIDNSLNSSSFITSVFPRTTYTGILTNFQGFTLFSYKIGLIKCLIDRAYKINNTNFGFTNAVSEIKATLRRNLFPSYLIDKVKIIYSEKVKKNDNQPLSQTEPNLRYFKLPYLDNYSETLKTKLNILTKSLSQSSFHFI